MNTEGETMKKHTEAAADDLVQSARQTATEAGETARSAIDSIASAARGTIERARESVAEGSDAVAARLRALAEEDLSDTLPGRAMKGAATQLSRASDELRNADFAGMLQSSRAFARRNPEIVAVGFALAGFALLRLVRGASSSRRETKRDKAHAEALS